MSEPKPLPSIPEPESLLDDVFDAMVDKAGLPLRKMVVLGILAGAYIGLGGMFATVALAGADDTLAYGAGQILAGLVFATGLAFVIIAGGELFTGNTLMIGPVVAGRVGPGEAAKALVIVYCANFAGSVMLALLVYLSGLHLSGEGAVGRAALDIVDTKTGVGFATTVASGILANMLVCLAVWLAHSGRTTTDKILGLLLPIAAFVAAGWEHSVANMYLLTYGWMVQASTDIPSGDAMGFAALLGNLVPATIGNIVGGALLATAYWIAYGKSRDKD